MKINYYRKLKKAIEKQKRKETKNSQRILKAILTFSISGFSIVTKLWLGKKRLTLLTLLWLTSLFGYNSGENSSRKQIKISQQEIHQLKSHLEELPDLKYKIKNQGDQLQEMATELEEKKIWGEEFRAESSILEDNLEKLNQKLTDTKTKESDLSKKHLQKDQEITSMKNKISELKLKAKKDNITIHSSKKTVEKSEKSLKEKLKTTQEASKELEKKLQNKNLEMHRLEYSFDQKIKELNNSQNKIDSLELTQTNLQEKTGELNQSRFEIESLNTQAKKDFELIKELQEKLKEKEKNFSQFEQELAEIHQELKSLTETVGKKGQIKWAFYVNAIEHILSYKVFKLRIPR
jgi:chromosome segregation ATPase